MSRKNYNQFKNVSVLKKTIVLSIFFISSFGGVYAFIVTTFNIKNYYSPYLFSFIFGGFGLLVGLLVSSKIKPHVLLNPTMRDNYYSVSIIFSFGFIGCFMFFGQLLNSRISNLYKCDEFEVVDKEFHKGGTKRIEKRILIVEIENEYQRIHCFKKIWDSTTIGQKVNVCIYESPIGFDYLTLKDNK
jgi:hypothetical protein